MWMKLFWGFVSMVCLLPATSSIAGSRPSKVLYQKYYSDLKPDGSYEYAFETSNGIYAEQRGIIGNSEAKALEVSGSFQYESPDRTPVHLTYTADENGFRPQGSHLPTPPPIPPQILRALKWIEEQQKKKQHQYAADQIKEEFFNHVAY